MRHKKLYTKMITAGILLAAAMGLWLEPTAPASAQCGSQASSCKNCHEVQGEMPVNNDGTAWHASHAFGDFCYICHAGNNQAKDEAEAHTGMVPPLSDVKASCQQCHPNDMQELAQIYATTLGVEIGDASAPASVAPTSGSEPSGAVAAISAPVTTELDIDDPNIVDFVQRYNEIVLGKRPVNVGNAILVVLIGLVAVGGGGFVLYNETLAKMSIAEARKVDGEYPADVVDLLPGIAKLKPQSRKSLKNILENPEKTETVLRLIDALVSEEKTGEKTQ